MADKPRQDLYLEISRNLVDRELRNLRNYVSGVGILPASFDQKASAHQIFNQLEKERKLKPGDLSLLSDLLRKIGRHDYAEQAEEIAENERKGVFETLKHLLTEVTVEDDSRTDTYNRLARHVAESGLTFREEVPKDGNCMFHAVADQLFRTEGRKISHVDLRKQAVDYLRMNPYNGNDDHLSAFVPDQNWEVYLGTMSRDVTWGDHIVLQAMADMFGHDVSIVSSVEAENYVTILTPSTRTVSRKEPPLVLGHYAENHYASLDGSSSVPLEVQLGGPELRALYYRACEEGETEVFSTRFVLFGKFGNGKTNLCNSLLGYNFDPEWKITDSIAIHPCVMTKEGQWKELKEMASDEKQSQETKLTRSTVGKEHKVERPPEAYLEAVKIFSRKDDDSSVTGTREHPHISIWDFGGQEIFYSTQQVFYTHRAIYGMTLNLTKALDSPVEKTDGDPICHCQTEKDYIDYHLESIRMHTRPSRDTKPPVLFIFTHKDQVTQETKQKFYSKTRAHLKGRVIDKHVQGRYFSVDNTKRSPEDPEVTELRKFILKVAKEQSYMGEKIPIKWLELKSELQDMHKDGKRYCGLKDVMEAVGSPPTDVTPEENAINILTFWHLCGDILFFPVQSLRNFVILEPQWFVDVCKTIITIPQYQDQSPGDRKDWDWLRETGELRDRLIENVWSNRKDFLEYNLIDHKQELLDMMEKFDLVLRCHGRSDEETGPKYVVVEEATYFVPALLTTVTDYKKLYPSGIARSKPIFIVFDGRFCPIGLYHRLVISSMRRYFKKKPLAYASCARFITSNPRQTFIVTKEKFYLKVELMSSVQDDASRFSHGPGVREGLDEDLRQIIDKWAPGIRYKWCLKCSCADHKEKEDADCFLPIQDLEAYIRECFKNGNVVCETYAPATTTVQDAGLADWFQNILPEGDGRSPARPVCPPSSAVDVSRYFDKVVRGVSANWDDLARKLNFEENEIDVIEERKRDQDSRCREMLKRWRNRKGKGKAATFRALKKALIKIGHTLTADGLDDLSDSSESSDE
ncbi:Hypp5498 [Branchiostoma lanceolatum]|uniref:Hypp5498 protein n=1 Tax=Branchiostoma lanceolatum TaxID=7740 RepID=A0A8J9VER2_BRALA|nr:Hypp5498 [Branchiostoma lanceolatum]